MDDVDALATRGVALLREGSANGDLAALDLGVELLEEWLAAAPRTAGDRTRHLYNLSLALGTRFERSGSILDLDRAITYAEGAAAAAPRDDPNRSLFLSFLVHCLRSRIARTEDDGDVDRAIAVGEELLSATPGDDARGVEYLSALGYALRVRYRRHGRLADLERAIVAREAAVAATPPADPALALRLSELGLALRARFERLGDLADLDAAISFGDEAVAAAERDSDPRRPAYLSNVAYALRVRFQRLGSATDLDRSIARSAEAVSSAHADDRMRPGYLSNLGDALRIRFEQVGDRSDLDRAVACCAEAVEATSLEEPDAKGFRHNLSVALAARFERDGSGADLDRAISLGNDVLVATRTDDPRRAMYLSGLGWALRAKFELAGRMDDLDRAIDVDEQALAATPGDHPERATLLLNLCLALGDRHVRTKRDEDHARAADLGREAAAMRTAPPDVRARAAWVWGRSAVGARDWDDAVEAYESAVRLAAVVVPRSLARADQEQRLSGLRGLGREAAAAAIQAGRIETAVELLELGQGVLFSQLLDARTDLTDLRVAHPVLAADFDRLRDGLDRLVRPDPAPGLDALIGAQLEADRRREAADGLDAVIARIRTLDGFERFLLPPSATDLQPAAVDGPVVLINISELRSDALVLTGAEVEVVPLPAVSPDAVGRQVVAFMYAVGGGAEQRRIDFAPGSAADPTGLSEVLVWLWDHITGPVLEHLGLTARPGVGAEWPRVWWCPAGPLAMLPLHASGRHATRDDDHPATVVDRVVSSNTPTVRALLHGRGARSDPGRGRLLVVAMPETPGQQDLPGARREAELLTALLPGQVDVLGLPGTPAADHAAVTTALPGHRYSHLCCHGMSDLHDPSASFLALTDYRSRPLTVLDLIGARLEDAELAFLSACSTARSGTALPDEPIHLAAACQLAGYRHVIATLWPIHDRDAVAVTEQVYAAITRSGEQLDADAAAVALHGASRRLREQYPLQPERWAPYTHLGP